MSIPSISNFMRVAVVVLLFVVSSLPLFAQGSQTYQPAVFKDIIVPRNRIDTIHFPQVVLKDTRVQEKINSYLQLLILDEITSPKNLLKRVKAELNKEMYGPGLTNLSYEIKRNDGRLLTLDIFVEGIGAYPSSTHYYVTFDLLNGNPVIAEDLFSASGYPVVMQMIRDTRRRLAKEGIEEGLRYELDSMGKHTAEDIAAIKEDYKSIEEDYFANCAEDAEATLILLTDSIFEPSYSTCLPHVIQARDIVWNVNIPIRSIVPHLSPYGKGLLGLTEPERNPELRQPFKYLTGTVGGYPITMVIDSPFYSTDLNAFYYYNNKGTSIPLLYERNGDSIVLKESSNDEQGERFIGTMKDGTYTGTWYDASRKKTLPFTLTY